MKSIHTPGPFGGCDEMAEQAAFEHLVGSISRAFRLMHIMTEPGRGSLTSERIAIEEGYTLEQIEAWRHL
jgi:hypothetical protein